MGSAKVKLNIRPEVSETIAWSLFRGSQEELQRLVEDHHAMVRFLTLEEREAVCQAWKVLEEVEEMT